MYEEFYGFHQSPFSITPDPRFLFLSAQHQEALDHLRYGLTERKGFIQITGEVGSGKTTVCRALLEELGPRFQTALVLNPMQLTSRQLIRLILIELGLDPGDRDRMTYLRMLDLYLLRQLELEHDVVLLIDEAQDLNPELLEQIRLLSNLETDQRKLLQIVLIGQPELRDMLDHRSLRQLRQRITVRYHLRPLSLAATEDYIQHRLQIAGGNSRPHFQRGAVRRIYRYSRGIPRLINAVCDKTLLCGYVTGADTLTARHVRRAVHELEGRSA